MNERRLIQGRNSFGDDGSKSGMGYTNSAYMYGLSRTSSGRMNSNYATSTKKGRFHTDGAYNRKFSRQNMDPSPPTESRVVSRRYEQPEEMTSVFSASNARKVTNQFNIDDIEKSRERAAQALRYSTRRSKPSPSMNEYASEYSASNVHQSSKSGFPSTRLQLIKSKRLRSSNSNSTSYSKQTTRQIMLHESKYEQENICYESKYGEPIDRNEQCERMSIDNSGESDCCDRCDSEDHTTSKCPWFKKSRDKHPDALNRKRGGIGDNGDGKIVYLKSARVISMPGDGSCLFHSLSYGLGGSITARKLRRDIATFIAKNPKLEIAETPLKDWIQWDSGRSVSSYANRMSVTGWGGGIECAACSRLMEVNVHIYERQRGSSYSRSSSSNGTCFKRISCFDLPGSKKKRVRTINVLYCGGVHYNALEIK